MKTIRIIAITAFLSVAFLGTLNEATKTAPVQPRQVVAIARTSPPAKPEPNCLPSSDGGPCLPFSAIQKMMQEEPDAPQPAKIKVTKI